MSHDIVKIQITLWGIIMDGAIKKIGIYDFFCVFISGLLFTSICLLSGTLERLIIWTGNDSTIRLLIFLSISFFVGLFLQGIGAFVDEKCSWMRLSHQARESFLAPGKHSVFKKEAERSQFERIVNEAIANNYNGTAELDTLEEKCYWAYQFFSTMLEYHGKDAKVERIGSIFGMLRSLMIMGAAFSAIHLVSFIQIIHEIICLGHNVDLWCIVIKLISFAVMTVFFKHRASKFASYKVRVVLREYRQLADERKGRSTSAGLDDANVVTS